MVHCLYCGWPLIMLFVFTDKILSNTPSTGWEITTHCSAYSQVTTYFNCCKRCALQKKIIHACYTVGRVIVINQILLLIVMFVSFGLSLKNILNHTYTHRLENISGLTHLISVSLTKVSFGFYHRLLQTSKSISFLLRNLLMLRVVYFGTSAFMVLAFGVADNN